MPLDVGKQRVVSRRRFLGWSQSALAAVGALPWLGAAAKASEVAPEAAVAEDYYAKLGVEKIINAAGSYTYLTAAVMPPPVQRAVAQAALHPVVLQELQQAAGEYIAKRLRCEAALVTSGASAALTLSTAACIVAAKGVKPEQIPELDGALKYEVIVQKAHRYEYDHAMQLCGVKIVEVETLEEYLRAFNAKTVMTNFYNAGEGGLIDRATWLAVAHKHGVQ